MVEFAHMSLVERVARVMAGEALSSNANGSDPSAGDKVDRAWRQHIPEALAVLHAIREPDEAAAAAGDAAIWQRMIEASIASAE
jgi:hypothetical protein